MPLWDYYQLARALNNKRWADGQSIAFQELREGIHTDEDGMVQEGSLSVSNLIVQEFMILANHAVGAILKDNRRVAPFRNHKPSRKTPPTREQIIAEIERTSDYLSLVDNLRSTWSKFLSAAVYEHRATGHFGIGLPVYIHFTSPIRRYADLVTHRVVKALIDETRPPYSRQEMMALCQHLNKRGRRLATLRTIQTGTNSLYNYRSFGHLLHREKNGQADFVTKLLDYLKTHRIGNPFFEFTASNGFNIELTCLASVRFQRIRHQVKVSARADKHTVKNEAARLLYRKVRSLVAEDQTQAKVKKPTAIFSKNKSTHKEQGPVSALYQICEAQGYEIPTYHYECWSGGPGPISCFCRISDALTVIGYGDSREDSRKEAASKMLNYLTSGQHISQSSIHPPADETEND